jgi:chromosomal replication initiator protein
LRQLALTAVDGDEVTISQPTVFLRDWSAKHHGDRLTTLWRAEDPDIRRVNITVGTRGPPHTS